MGQEEAHRVRPVGLGQCSIVRSGGHHLHRLTCIPCSPFSRTVLGGQTAQALSMSACLVATARHTLRALAVSMGVPTWRGPTV